MHRPPDRHLAGCEKATALPFERLWPAAVMRGRKPSVTRGCRRPAPPVTLDGTRQTTRRYVGRYVVTSRTRRLWRASNSGCGVEKSAHRFPPCAKRGEVSASYADGGVMGHSLGAAHDPSVADYRATSPRCAQGGIQNACMLSSKTMGERARRAIVFDRSCRTRPTPPRRLEFNEREDSGATRAPASIAWYQLLWRAVPWPEVRNAARTCSARSRAAGLGPGGA